jgi:predicted PurR-regulated permease PerM
MSASPAGGTVGAAGPGQASGGAAAAPPGRLARVRAAAAARGIPLPTIIATVAVVVLTYLAGKVLYRLRDVILLMVVAGFVALILNPLVVYVQRWIPRRGWAVAIVTVWAALVFVGRSSIGDWLGGLFGAFVAALLSIPCAAALQIIVRELWQATAPGGPLGGGES